jgi:transposase-like protein
MVSVVPRTRPAYPSEFRREAIELLRAGRSPRELSESLGVSEQTLRNWRRQDQIDRRERDDGVTSDERAELARLRRENTRLRQERDLLKRAAAILRDGERDPVTCYRIVLAEKARTPVSVACELLGVSTSGFYAWASRAPSDRALSDAWMVEKIKTIHAENRGVTGRAASRPSCGSARASWCRARACSA